MSSVRWGSGLSQCDLQWMVHSQHVNCDSSDCGSAFDVMAQKHEVIVPDISSGIEQSRKGTVQWVASGDIRAFRCIAVKTRPRQIFQLVTPLMLDRDDVVHDERLDEPVAVSTAILATVRRPVAHRMSQFLVHGVSPERLPLRRSACRARSFRIDSN